MDSWTAEAKSVAACVTKLTPQLPQEHIRAGCRAELHGGIWQRRTSDSSPVWSKESQRRNPSNPPQDYRGKRSRAAVPHLLPEQTRAPATTWRGSKVEAAALQRLRVASELKPSSQIHMQKGGRGTAKKKKKVRLAFPISARVRFSGLIRHKNASLVAQM